MAGVSSALVALLEWLLVGFADIVKLIRDGKRTVEQLQPLKTAVQAVIDGKEFEVVFPAVTEETSALATQLASWQKFYQEQFGLDCDFSRLSIPQLRKGFNRLIVVAQGITIQQVYNQCAKRFECWKYTDRDLDVAAPINERDSKSGSYAIWIRDTIEADDQYKNCSANWLKQHNILGMTLLERLLFELKCWLETGKHLDIQNITLCSGSRNDDGDVPIVYWSVDRLWVGWCFPGGAVDSLRAREVVAA